MAGLPPSLVEGAEHIIPFKSSIDLVSRSAKRLEAAEFGLQVGVATSIRSLPKLGKAIERSTTLLEAITAVIETLSGITNVRRIWLDIGSKTASLCHASPNVCFRGKEYAEQFALMLLINLVREVADKEWGPRRVTVSRSNFDLIGNHPELLNNTEVDAGEFTSFTFEACLLLRHLPVQSVAERQYARMLPEDKSPEVPNDFIGAMCAILETNLRSGRVGLNYLTQSMGMGPRTLQRKLAERGVTYDQLLGEARLRVARELLADPDTRIAEISLELGYQDPANFTRAFKRWTGLAPFEYRSRLLLEENASH